MAWKASCAVVLVAEDLPADAEHHRSVPLDQDREGEFGRLAAASGVPLQQLSVRQASDAPHVEKRVNVPKGGPCAAAVLPSVRFPGSHLSRLMSNVMEGAVIPTF